MHTCNIKFGMGMDRVSISIPIVENNFENLYEEKQKYKENNSRYVDKKSF